MPAPRRLALTTSVALLAALGSAAPALAAPTGQAVRQRPALAVHPAAAQHRHHTAPLILGPGASHLAGPYGQSSAAATNYSANWSGYAAIPQSGTGPYSRVSANWTAPSASCTDQDSYSAFWVGLDGVGSSTVEQTGTSADCSGGSPVYYGWYEMFPAYPVQFNDPVVPGDQIQASVASDGQGGFTLTLDDTTQGWIETTKQQQSDAQLASAEVIAEAPSSSSGVLPLTDFGTADFTGASVNGGSMAAANPAQIDMGSSGLVRATTSGLSGGTDFSVAWQHS
jgi:hypothetical protein